MGNLQPSSVTNHAASSSLTLPGRHKCSFTADPESFVCYGKVSTVEPIIVIYNSATVHFKSNRFLSLMLVPVLFTVVPVYFILFRALNITNFPVPRRRTQVGTSNSVSLSISLGYL